MSDTDIVQAISRIIAEEEFASDAVRKIRSLLAEPESPSRGVIEFEGAVIELPDEQGTAWERHDDPRA